MPRLSSPVALGMAGVLAGFVAPHAARAQPAPRQAVTFADAIGLTHGLPELVAARDAAAASAKISVPRAWAPLLILATPQWRVMPRDARGPEGTVTVQQPIPLDDVAGARRGVVTSGGQLRTAEAAAAQLEARLAAAAAWIEGWAAAARLEAADHDLVLARQLLAATERGAAAGAFTQPELSDARAFVAEAEVRRTDAEGQVSDTAFALAAATGQPGELGSEGALPEAPLPEPASWDQLLARARRLPAVTARRLTARVARARAVEERAARGRQVILGGELARDAPDGLVVGLSIGLALPHDRGQREVRQLQVEAALADGEAAGLARRAAIELGRARHDVDHTGELLALLRDRLVPVADDAAARRQRAFEVGESTIVELLVAQRTALAARARLADARAAHAWARVHAWLLVQTTEPTP